MPNSLSNFSASDPLLECQFGSQLGVRRLRGIPRALPNPADEVSATAAVELATSEWNATKRTWVTFIRPEITKHFAKVKPQLSEARAKLVAEKAQELETAKKKLAALAPPGASVPSF